MAKLRGRAARVIDLAPVNIASVMGTDRVVTRLLRPLVNRVVPDREIAVTVRSGVGRGLRLPIFPRSEKYYWTGLHELHVQQTLQRKLREGSVFWDVGGHIGFTSLIASRLVGSAGRVDTFEPFPPNQERLARSIQLNGCTNVTVHHQALAATVGQQVFHLNASSLMGSLVEGSGADTIDVACTTLDAVADQIPPPDLIKIDTEGAELEVLDGGRQFLAAAQPELIVEFTTRQLLDLGLQLFPFYTATHLGQNHWLLSSGGA